MSEIGVTSSSTHWQKISLSDVFSVSSGEGLSQTQMRPGNHPVYGGNGITGFHDTFLFEASRLIIGRVGEYCGNVYITRQKSWVTDNALIATFHDEAAYLPFWFYYLNHLGLNDFAFAAAQPVITGGIFERISGCVPPLPQQRKIARILTTLDNVITQTEALIAKYQAIKQGLMHDLFTRGVDATGKLRPPQSEAPELYKQSELGWIPKEWGTSTLESLLADVPYAMRSGPFGSSLLKADLVEQGIPYLGIDNIHPEHFCPEFRRFVSPSQFQQLQRYAVREGDVVITIMGTVGRCCVIPDGIGNALSSKHIWTMSVAQDRYLPVLLCWQLNHSPWVLSTFRGKSQGGIMDSISSTTLKTLLLPHPPIGEQREIARRYESGTNEITLQELALGKFKLQKNGLMQDLLTGKVRVNVEV